MGVSAEPVIDTPLLLIPEYLRVQLQALQTCHRSVIQAHGQVVPGTRCRAYR